MNTPADRMAQALRLAERGRYSTFPNPRVGCLVVRDGEVVGEGWHERAGEPHAEVHALRMAGERTRGAELYVTLEPCAHQGRTPPCVDAVLAAAPRKVYVAMLDPDPRVAGRGIERLRAAGIEVEVGLLEAAARRLNRGFLSRIERGRPYLTLKLAASLDGRAAMNSGESRWITGVEARADVHRLRAEAGAVLTGSGTVLADDPELTVRDESLAARAGRQPDRIVLDAQARVPADAKLWRPGARRLRIAASSCGTPEIADVERLKIDTDPAGRLDLPTTLTALATAGINEVLAECGPTLAGALLAAGLVDELIVYLAPALLGHEARAFASLPGLERLDQKIGLRFTDLRQIGSDLRITAAPAARGA